MESFFFPNGFPLSVPAPYYCGLHNQASSGIASATLDLAHPSPYECHMYEQYTHLPELSATWHTKIWPEWTNETILRPALHALELTFRMIYALSCDARSYVDTDQWLMWLESLVNSELEVVALLCERDHRAPTTLPQMLHVNEAKVVVSQETLLGRLALLGTKTQELVYRIHLGVECQMMRAPFTLGLGEPNLSGKPVLCFDAICNPAQMCQIKPCDHDREHPEEHTLCTVHQIVECWMAVSQSLLQSIDEKASYAQDLAEIARLSWIVDRIWKIASSALNLLVLMDPNDFMKLKHHLAIRFTGPAYCLRSLSLRTVTEACKDLRRLLPKVVGVDADPKGGPRLQEAVMNLLLTHDSNDNISASSAAIHVLQAFQAIEMSLRQFYFSYQQLIVSIMGSVEFKYSPPLKASGAISAVNVISEIYMEPSYFPSLDGAKIFLADYWHHHHGAHRGESSIGQLNQRLDNNSSVSSSMWTDSDSGSSLLSQEAEANQS